MERDRESNGEEQPAPEGWVKSPAWWFCSMRKNSGKRNCEQGFAIINKSKDRLLPLDCSLCSAGSHPPGKCDESRQSQRKTM